MKPELQIQDEAPDVDTLFGGQGEQSSHPLWEYLLSEHTPHEIPELSPDIL